MSSTTSIPSKIRRALEQQATADKSSGIRAKFANDADRVNRFSQTLEDIYFDFSKTHITDELVEAYALFADEINFNEKRHALFAGARINATENRSVLHTLLRDPTNHGIATEETELIAQAQLSYQDFVDQYQQIQQQLDARETPIKNIIHIGIGGSSLGTQLIFEALKRASTDIQIHFVANIDAHQLVAVLEQCDIDSTMVIGVSKTFTTAETLRNIRSVGEWYASQGGQDFFKTVYAVTAQPANADKFGVPAENTVVFPEWVGGRYSVWSSVSLSAALVLGMERFQQFLAGAAAMDEYFYNTDAADNLCFIAAMLDHYYSNFFNAQSRAIFAYDYRLRSLVDYLQQLETESNGKDRQTNGEPVDQQTSPVVWGGVGTDVQHSVFQMMHQGTSLIPTEFLLVAQADHDLPQHHNELLANGVAQTAALLAGQDIDTVKALHADEGLSELTAKAKVFSGDRPSFTFLLERLTPRVLGSLLAFYEHRTFCGGVLTNINSYDQMGVELGKRLANEVKPYLDSEAQDMQKLETSDFDASTKALLQRITNR